MDKVILDCTKENITYRKNRWFLEGDPKAILMVEFRGDSLEEATQKAENMIADLQSKNMGYAFPIIPPEQTKKVRDLRKAGLGLLANIPGDKKAVACIEDTAVALEDLADYIEEFGKIMDEFGQQQVVYAHALSLIHISEPTRRYAISYAVFCLKKKQNSTRSKVKFIDTSNPN